MKKVICLDSSLIIKALTDEDDSDKASDLLSKLIELKFLIKAPEYIKVEIRSVLLKKLILGKITKEYVDWALDSFNNIEIEFIKDEDLLTHAFETAMSLKIASIYDSLYLSIAELVQCPLVTADLKFLAKAKTIYKDVYSLKAANKIFGYKNLQKIFRLL